MSENGIEQRTVKHPQHIVCVKASRVPEATNGKTVQYTLNNADLMLGQRNSLEEDTDFRQVLSVAVLLHKGKIWTYRRAKSGGETRLHGLLAAAVGGHWDAEDLVWNESILDLKKSIAFALERELDEEVTIRSQQINVEVLDSMLCSSATKVDRLHMAQVTVYELDGEDVFPNETQLEAVGFMTPEELLARDDCETWTTLIAEIIQERNAQALAI